MNGNGLTGLHQLTQWGDGLDFLSHAVVAVIDEPNQIEEIVHALDSDLGSTQNVAIVQGQEAFQQFSHPHNNASFDLMKSLRRLLGQETEHWTQYLEHMRDGRAIVRIPVSDSNTQAKGRIANILTQHGARFVNFYGQWTIERLAY